MPTTPSGSYIVIEHPSAEPPPFPWYGTTGESAVRVRAAATTQAPILRKISARSPVTLLSITLGESVEADNNQWYAVAGGGFVWSGLVRVRFGGNG